MCLILDVKTRWNSLHSMLERFLLLRKAIHKALVCLEVELTLLSFSDQEIEKLKEVHTTLSPIVRVEDTLSTGL